jgi:hypothetical protein
MNKPMYMSGLFSKFPCLLFCPISILLYQRYIAFFCFWKKKYFYWRLLPVKGSGRGEEKNIIRISRNTCSKLFFASEKGPYNPEFIFVCQNMRGQYPAEYPY